MKEKKNPARRRNLRRAVLAAGGAAFIFALFWIIGSGVGGKDDLRIYDYRATRMLVRLTDRAARLLEEKGEAAFDDFRRDPDRWSVAGQSYLYVYDRAGVNLFHGGYPGLEGQDLGRLTDLLGKPLNLLVLDQLDNHEQDNPHGWIHYLWAAPGSLQGAWKSSCNFPVALPDGREVYVGSGCNTPLVEREFFRIVVDQAAGRLEAAGRAALAELKEVRGPFTIFDEAVFVLDLEGRSILDPALDLEDPRDLFSYRDLSGRFPLRDLAERLRDGETAWVVTLDRGREGGDPVKKGIYGRRSSMDGREVIVGAVCDLPHPSWMR